MASLVAPFPFTTWMMRSLLPPNRTCFVTLPPNGVAFVAIALCSFGLDCYVLIYFKTSIVLEVADLSSGILLSHGRVVAYVWRMIV